MPKLKNSSPPRQGPQPGWVRLEVAVNVAAGLWPAVEPGLPARRKEPPANPARRIFVSRQTFERFVRAAGCTPSTAAKMAAVTVAHRHFQSRPTKVLPCSGLGAQRGFPYKAPCEFPFAFCWPSPLHPGASLAQPPPRPPIQNRRASRTFCSAWPTIGPGPMPAPTEIRSSRRLYSIVSRGKEFYSRTPSPLRHPAHPHARRC